jgi:HEAT repeat protein
MAMTMNDVRAALDPDEPNCGRAKGLGPAALPFLLELVRGGDLGLASKATYLASLIPSDTSVRVIEAAAATNEPILRVAAASGLQNLKPTHAERVLKTLRHDADPGVRKVMVKSAAKVRSPRIAAALKQIAKSDPEPFVRDTTARLLAAPTPTAPRVRKVATRAATSATTAETTKTRRRKSERDRHSGRRGAKAAQTRKRSSRKT